LFSPRIFPPILSCIIPKIWPLNAFLENFFFLFFPFPLFKAPFNPFITENIYQNLRPYCPSSTEDDRSVHFLPFPTVTGTFSSDVERRFSKMKSVIEAGRAMREKVGISLKTPLNEVIYISNQPEDRNDVESLQDLICEVNSKFCVVFCFSDFIFSEYGALIS